MIQTPYYLIDKSKLLQNMEKIATLRELSGAKALLALKCFATWSVFDFMREYMDGTTSSSLNEVRLGHERFGKETHAYSVAWADSEVAEAVGYADKIIFNSIGQLERFDNQSATIARGLRPFNPFWAEDPIKMTNPQALATYAQRSGLPVCASETMATRAQFLDVLRADAD